MRHVRSKPPSLTSGQKLEEKDLEDELKRQVSSVLIDDVGGALSFSHFAELMKDDNEMNEPEGEEGKILLVFKWSKKEQRKLRIMPVCVDLCLSLM